MDETLQPPPPEGWTVEQAVPPTPVQPPWTPIDLIRQAWDRFWLEPGIIVGVLLITYIVPGILENILSIFLTGHSTFNLEPKEVGWEKFVVVELVSAALGISIGAGSMSFYIAVARSKSVGLEDFFRGFERLFHFIGAAIVMGVCIFVGLVFCIVPGILISLAMGQMIYFAVDKGMNPIEAAQASIEVTRGRRLEIFVFSLLIVLVNLAGFLACCVGILIAIPVCMIAQAMLYVRLTEKPEGPPAEVVAA